MQRADVGQRAHRHQQDPRRYVEITDDQPLTVLRDHSVVARPGQEVVPEPTLTLRPKGGLPLQIVRRGAKVG